LRILQRYLWRELAVNFLSVTGVLLAILLVYQCSAVLSRAAELQYPGGVILRLFALGAVQNITLLLPFGILLAVVLAFGRLYHDNEMFAAQACGLGVARLHAAVLALAIPVAVLAGALTLLLAPRAATGESRLRAEAVRSALAEPFAAGQFRSFSGGRTVVYARAVGADGQMRDVFIKRSSGSVVETTVASSARTHLADDGLSETIVLQDGQRIEGVPGSARQRIVRFREQSIPVVIPPPATFTRRVSELSTAQLLRSRLAAERTELHLRAAWPLMTLVLAVCAVPLSRQRPRQGRFARVWVAVLFFAVYAALLQVAGLWLERGTTPAVIGLWWVHGLFAAIGWTLARSARPRRSRTAS
jgi:lipopolysaccharide export system permease protein